MASVTSYPSGGTSWSVAPESDDAWVNPGQAAQGASEPSDTAASITAATFDAGDNSTRLRLTAFGFAIPTDATIDGILVEVRRYCAAGAAADYRIQLQDDTAALVGDNKAATGTNWPASYGVASYGGAADAWNAGLTPAKVNNSNFGVIVSALASGANTDIYVAWARVTVYYTVPPPALVGSAGGTSSGTASIKVARRLIGTATGTSSASGTRTNSRWLAAAGAGASSGAGVLIGAVPLVGAAAGSSSGTAAFEEEGGAPPAVLGTSTVVSTASESITTIGLPAEVVNGAVMYLAVYLTATTGTINTPSGWTPLHANVAAGSSTSSHASLFRKVANNEPAGYDITHSSGRCSASIVALSGVDTTTPEFDSAAQGDTTAALSVPSPSVTPTAATLLLTWHGGRILGNGAVAQWAPDAAEAEVLDIASAVPAASNSSHEAASQSVASGATGTRTAVASGSGVTSVNWIGMAVVVKPAAGGGAARALAGTATGTSSGAAALSRKIPLAASAAGTSTGAAVLRKTVPLTASAGGTSTGAGAIRVARRLIAAGAGTSTGAAALTKYRWLTGAAGGTSTVAGGIRVARRLTATAGGTSTASVVVSPRRGLLATATGTSTAAGSILRRLALTGAATGTASGSGRLAGVVPVAASAGGTSSASAALRVARRLTASASGASTAAGSIRVARRFTGSATGTSSGTAALFSLGQVLLVGGATGTSTAGPVALNVRRTLLASATGHSSGAAVLRGAVPLVATAGGHAAATAVLRGAVPVSGAAAGHGQASAVVLLRRGLLGVANGTSSADASFVGAAGLHGLIAGTSSAIAHLTFAAPPRPRGTIAVQARPSATVGRIRPAGGAVRAPRPGATIRRN